MNWKILVIALIIIALVSAIIYPSMHNSIVRVRASTTTSLYATGLLEYLSSRYSRMHPGVVFDYIPVGSGEALKRAESGDVCLVLVHAPSLERKYLEMGVIGEHHIFAYNYFIIAGPRNDPAGVKTSKSAVEAFEKIYRAGEEGLAVFISRGDYSGTHVRELMIWNMTGLNPRGRPWYLETGSGMSQTLLVAEEKRGYVLSDIGTYLKLRGEGRIPDLEILYSNSSELINIYSVYIVESCSGVRRVWAERFIEYLTGEGQELIAEYGLEDYGRSLFYPAVNKTDWLMDEWIKLSGK